MHNKAGTVGRLLPKIDYKLEKVEGINEGGRLFIRGPNIMLGYLDLEGHRTYKEWYDTGDIVKIDSEGYITILGRLKRFAKIVGEMISLTKIEELASEIAPDSLHAAISIADKTHGEKIILLTTGSDINRENFADTVSKAQISLLHLPKVIITDSEIPLLASGKIDYLEIMKNVDRF